MERLNCTNLRTLNIVLMKCGRVKCDSSGQEILYLRALQGHSGRNPIDLSQQYNVLIPDNIFEYISHIECAINLHSITNSGLIPEGQIFGQGKTDVILYGCESHEQETQRSVRDCFTAPRLAWYKQKTWKRHQDTVYWVDTQFAQRKEFKFYQTRSNAIMFYDTLSAYCIPRVVVTESGEIIHEKVQMSPRFPPKISFKDSWMN